MGMMAQPVWYPAHLDHGTAQRMAHGSAAVAEHVAFAEMYPEATYQNFEAVTSKDLGVFYEGQPWTTECHADLLIAKLAEKHRCLKRTLAALARADELHRHNEHNPAVPRASTARAYQVATMAATNDGA